MSKYKIPRKYTLNDIPEFKRLVEVNPDDRLTEKMRMVSIAELFTG